MPSKKSNAVTRPDQIRAKSTEHLPPDDRRTAEWFPRLGYSLPDAVADLIDNSIDAKANTVLVRIVRTDDDIRRVLIVDNGTGMADAELSSAMRFGGGNPKGDNLLGKYGIGLKAASLSQAKAVTILTRQGKKAAGRRWTADNIAKGWLCEVLDPLQVAEYMDADYADVNLKKSGTIVVWDGLLHLRCSSTTVDPTINKATRQLTNELGLRFHRFLSDGRLRISLDTQTVGAHLTNAQTIVEPLDPFDYPRAGKEGYPKKLQITLPEAGKITLDCHIWPPKSRNPGYMLGGGKVSARQGFYFYRNDRLIQAGGWNHCRDDDNEPHLSLARVKVDLPATMDAAFKLDIKKSGVEPPPAFAGLAKAAVSGAASFMEFTSDAKNVYSKQKKKDGALFTYLPGKGFSKGVRDTAKTILWEQGTGRPRAVSCEWKNLSPGVFVEIDRNGQRLVLNALYRQNVLQNSKASAADAPLVKMLLLMLFQEEFDRKADSARFKVWRTKVNQALIASLGKET